MVLTVSLCLTAAVFSDQLTSDSNNKGLTMEYESVLFDTSEIISINIVIGEDDWNEMLDNATAEEYYRCDVVVNGETFYGVGIRPKGNTSLTTIAADPTTDRYSFKLEFDHYVDGQTCFGLDKLVLNNNYADATNMKEALIYDMYQYLGADASLYNYAQISVNGEYWGVYLAIEAVEDSFMLRNYGTQDGELYKPDSMNIGGFDMGDMDMGDFSPSDMPGGGSDFSRFQDEMPERFETPESGSSNGSPEGSSGSSQPPDRSNFDFGGMGFGGFSLGGGGSDLNYADDNLDNYSTIWEGEITNTNDSDHKRVVTALKNISEGSELESYMDIDNLLRYMAVHIFSVNEDSLSGMMAHNYYLYEHDGQLTPPALDGLEATGAALQVLYPSSRDNSVDLFGREAMLSEYVALQDQKKELAQRISQIENTIKADMQDAESGRCGAYMVSWKTQTRRLFQPKEFSLAHPEIDLQEFYRDSSSRPFRVREISEDQRQAG